MTIIRDRRGWLTKLRGLRNRGPATTEERMEQLRRDLDALLEADNARDAEQRFRVAEGHSDVSPEGRAALAKGRSPHFLRHIARLIGGRDG